jgi:uncharacterized protein YdeI (YjbR/CyaY-like superfamily)
MPTDPRVDAYIAKAAPFARPILTHLRTLVHRACPDVGETIKWSMPFFVHRGNLCHMAAFKAHCAFGFWHARMRERVGETGPKADEAMGVFGRITSVDDLPPDRTLLGHLREAVKLNDAGVPAREPAKAKPKPAAKVPPDLAAGLQRDAQTAKAWAEFSPSARRDYVEWLEEAKRPETREKRLATTLAWVREGKSRNWKYERG